MYDEDFLNQYNSTLERRLKIFRDILPKDVYFCLQKYIKNTNIILKDRINQRNKVFLMTKFDKHMNKIYMLPVRKNIFGGNYAVPTFCTKYKRTHRIIIQTP